MSTKGSQKVKFKFIKKFEKKTKKKGRKIEK